MTLYTEKKLQFSLSHSLVLVFGLIVGIIAGMDGRHGREGDDWETPGPRHNRGSSTPSTTHPSTTVKQCGAVNDPCQYDSCCCPGNYCNRSASSWSTRNLVAYDSDSDSDEKRTGICKVKPVTCVAPDSQCTVEGMPCCSNDTSTNLCIDGVCTECAQTNATCSDSTRCCNSGDGCFVTLMTGSNSITGSPSCRSCGDSVQIPCENPDTVVCCGGDTCNKITTPSNTYTCTREG